MFTKVSHRMQALLVATVVCFCTVPALAQAFVPKEKTLNGVTLHSTFLEVLAKRGAPHYIGPTVGTEKEVLRLLTPEARRSAAWIFGNPYDSKAGMTPSGRAPRIEKSPEALEAEKPGAETSPKLPEQVVVWMYEGNEKKVKPGAGWYTFVFFDKTGEVIAVAVTVTNPFAQPPIKTASGIRFGSRLTKVQQLYDWPDNFVVLGQYYFFAYPDRNVSFAIDTVSRKVVGIAIGLPMAVNLPAGGGRGGPAVRPLPGGPTVLPGLPGPGSGGSPPSGPPVMGDRDTI